MLRRKLDAEGGDVGKASDCSDEIRVLSEADDATTSSDFGSATAAGESANTPGSSAEASCETAALSKVGELEATAAPCFTVGWWAIGFLLSCTGPCDSTLSVSTPLCGMAAWALAVSMG